MTKRAMKNAEPVRYGYWHAMRVIPVQVSTSGLILNGHRRARAAEHILSEPMTLKDFEENTDGPVDSPNS